MEIRFLNVDLEVESATNLKPLIEDLGDNVSVLCQKTSRNGFDFAASEIRASAGGDMGGVISSFCLLIENLSPDAKLIWEQSFSKKFDAGFESGSSQRNYSSEIRASTLKRVTEIGASIAITIYPQSAKRIKR